MGYGVKHLTRVGKPAQKARCLDGLRYASAAVATGVRSNMPKDKSSLERAAGKLISAVQKEWGEELGESTSILSEEVMNNCHTLLQAAKSKEVRAVLGGLSVSQYLGEVWVRNHPSVQTYIVKFESELSSSENL